MALAVVTIHNGAINTPDIYPFIVKWVIRSAVPFFFIVSGFFMARKLHDCKESEQCNFFLRKRAKQLIRIFGIWLIIYFPLSVYFYVNEDFSLIHSILAYCKSIVFMGESPYSWPLWFIYSLSIVTFLLSISYNKNLKRLLIFISILSYLSTYLATYTEFNPFRIITLTKLFLGRTLGGGIYILSGMYLYDIKNKNQIDNRSSYFIAIFMILISSLLYYYELPFWELCSGLGFVMIGLCINLRDSSLWEKLRIQSMWIYYCHMYIIMAMWIIFPELLIDNFIMFVASVYFLSVILAYLLYRIQKIPSCSKIGSLIR